MLKLNNIKFFLLFSITSIKNIYSTNSYIHDFNFNEATDNTLNDQSIIQDEVENQINKLQENKLQENKPIETIESVEQKVSEKIQQEIKPQEENKETKQNIELKEHEPKKNKENKIIIPNILKNIEIPTMNFFSPNGILSNSGINNYVIAGIATLIFFYFIKNKNNKYSLFEGLLMKFAPEQIIAAINSTPEDLRGFIIKSIFQYTPISSIFNFILGNPINTRIFFWLLFDGQETNETLEKINKTFGKYCLISIGINSLFYTLVWNMNESTSIVYYNILKLIAVSIISGIFTNILIYKTAINDNNIKEVKLDLLDLNKIFIYGHAILKAINDIKEYNANNKIDFTTLFKTDDILTLVKNKLIIYRKEFKEKYMNQFFKFHLVIIFTYVFYYNWQIINTLQNLKDSKNLKRKENLKDFQTQLTA